MRLGLWHERHGCKSAHREIAPERLPQALRRHGIDPLGAPENVAGVLAQKLDRCQTAAPAFSCSVGSGAGSAKKLMTVWPFGSRPFSMRSRRTVSGKHSLTSLNSDVFFPDDGSDPTYSASNGIASSTLNAPTMKNEK